MKSILDFLSVLVCQRCVSETPIIAQTPGPSIWRTLLLGHFRTEVLAMHMLCTSMHVDSRCNSICPLASFSWCQTFAAVQGTLHRLWKDTNGTCLKQKMLTRSEKCQFHESYTTYWIIKTNAPFVLFKHNLVSSLSQGAAKQWRHLDEGFGTRSAGRVVKSKAGRIEPCPPCPPHRQCANLQHVIHPHRDWRCSYRASFPPIPSSINLWKPMWKVSTQLLAIHPLFCRSTACKFLEFLESWRFDKLHEEDNCFCVSR